MELENVVEENIVDSSERESEPTTNNNDEMGEDAEKSPDIGPDGLPVEKKSEEESKEETDDSPPQLRVRRFATIMNCLNSLLGAGILGVPHALSYCGLVPSLIMLVIMAVLSHIGAVMTMKLATRKDVDSLDELARSILGRWGGIAISIGTMLFCISCMTSYIVIGFGTLASWFDAGGIDVQDKLWKRAIVVLVYFVLLPMPLTFPRDIKFLSPFSTATFIAVVIYVIAMIVKAAILLPYPPEKKPDIIVAKMGMGLFSAISIYGLAFAMPVVILPLVKPYNPSSWKRSLISFWTAAFGLVFVSVPGVIGYCLFGNDSKDVVLDNFSSKDALIIVVRVGFFIVVTCSFPCIGQSVMAAWSAMIFGTSNQGELPLKKRSIILILTNIIPLAFAIFLPRAGPALSIGGAFGGCLVDFFFPAIMWMKLSKKKLYHWQNILCILFAIFGLVSCAIATYQAIVDAIDAFSS